MNIEFTKNLGWRTGFRQVLRNECRRWWKSSAWWIHMLLWTVLLNGMTALPIWRSGMSGGVDPLGYFTLFAGLFPVIAGIITMQNLTIGERLNGTAAWVLSKPVAPESFVLAKFTGAVLNLSVPMIIVPSIGIGLQLSLAESASIFSVSYFGGIGLLLLHFWFYLALTALLGIFATRRAIVIIIPLLFAFIQQYLIQGVPFLGELFPRFLTMPHSETGQSLSEALMRGRELFSYKPVTSTAVLIVVFAGLAAERLKHREI